mmetsp:Transcript_31131/g.73084  ORF Transcript_31131/g.73084 Transcript_31131/m.73084 type:complete len:289 (+) Transcript_31131:1-867(+)
MLERTLLRRYRGDLYGCTSFLMPLLRVINWADPEEREEGVAILKGTIAPDGPVPCSTHSLCTRDCRASFGARSQAIQEDEADDSELSRLDHWDCFRLLANHHEVACPQVQSIAVRYMTQIPEQLLLLLAPNLISVALDPTTDAAVGNYIIDMCLLHLTTKNGRLAAAVVHGLASALDGPSERTHKALESTHQMLFRRRRIIHLRDKLLARVAVENPEMCDQLARQLEFISLLSSLGAETEAAAREQCEAALAISTAFGSKETPKPPLINPLNPEILVDSLLVDNVRQW